VDKLTDFAYRILEPISEFTGYDPIWIMFVLIIFGFFILRWGVEKPWSLLRVCLIVSILAGVAYAGFEFMKTGVAETKNLVRPR